MNQQGVEHQLALRVDLSMHLCRIHSKQRERQHKAIVPNSQLKQLIATLQDHLEELEKVSLPQMRHYQDHWSNSTRRMLELEIQWNTQPNQTSSHLHQPFLKSVLMRVNLVQDLSDRPLYKLRKTKPCRLRVVSVLASWFSLLPNQLKLIITRALERSQLSILAKMVHLDVKDAKLM